MKLYLTPFGHRVEIDPSDESLYEFLDELISSYENGEDEVELMKKTEDFLDSLFSHNIGYVATDDYMDCLLPQIIRKPDDVIQISIPDPGLVFMYGGDTAYDMLDNLCKSGMYKERPADETEWLAESIMDVYEAFSEWDKSSEEYCDDDETEDDEEYILENHDENIEDNEELTTDNTEQQELYCLNKASDLYKYKDIAKNFYMFKNGKSYMEAEKDKPYINPRLIGLKKCSINVKYAVKIEPKNL